MNKQLLSENHDFSNKIIAWYKDNQRDLPWRQTVDPYVIWLSEIILQQTRVTQGLPYFNKFLDTLPTVQHFAGATEEEILRLWQGLGYYSRARNMHATAKQIVNLYDGKFPTTYEGLTKLKGIGPYTAAAIASFAYNEMVPVVDGNVFRVLSRVFGVRTDIASSKARKVFTELAKGLIPKHDPATFNQAIMEFGALQCTPKKPNCMFCVLQGSCYAFQHQAQNQLPVKLSKTKIRNRYLNYFAIELNDAYLLKKRKAGDVWEGLYDFYTVETATDCGSLEELKDVIIDKLIETGEALKLVGSKKHVLSHQRIYANFWKVTLDKNLESTLIKNHPEDYNWFNSAEIEELPKSILTATFFKKTIA